MDNIYNLSEFDKSVSNFFELLKNDFNSNQNFNDDELRYFVPLIPEAIKYKLVPIVYESNIKFRKNFLSFKMELGNRILNPIQKFKSIFWFILFKIKWILFWWVVRNKKKIIVNVGCERKISQFYLEVAYEIARDKNSIVVSFNTLCSPKYLFNLKYFYYHSFSFSPSNRKAAFKKLSSFLFSKLKSFDKYFYNKKNIENNLYKNIIFLYKDYMKCKKFLKKYKNSTTGIIQNYDYSYNKYLYVELFKKNNIKTISLQHSIMFYNHLYKNIFSDYYFLWGKQERQRINHNEHTKLQIVGYPQEKTEFPNTLSEKTFVFYFLSSHDYATSQTDSRQLEYVNLVLQQIKRSLFNISPLLKFFVVPHPHDRKILYQGSTLLSSKRINSEILAKTKLLIFEDTTVIFDYLLMSIPILYISDENNNDPLQLKKYNSISIHYSDDNIHKSLLGAIHSKVDMKKRKELYSYFFNFATKFDYIKAIKNKLYNI